MNIETCTKSLLLFQLWIILEHYDNLPTQCGGLFGSQFANYVYCHRKTTAIGKKVNLYKKNKG